MKTPRAPLPKYGMPWLTAVGVCLFAARWLPEYRHILVGVGFLAGGPLLSYLAVAVPPGVYAKANANLPPFRRYPESGKHSRQLFFALGVSLALAGAAMLIGWA